MRIVLFSLFGYEVYSHGVFLVLGIITAIWLMYRLLKKEGFENGIFLNHYLSSAILSVIIGIIASRLLFFLLNIGYYSSVYQLFQIWNGGLTSYAGFIAGIICFWLISRKKGQEYLAKLINLAGIAFPLGIAVGRIGCTLNGEVGIKSKSIFAYYGYMPVTAFEIFICSAIFALNFYLYLHFRERLGKYTLFLNFSFWYLLSRTIIDQWRADPAIIFGLNYSQLFSLFLLLLLSLFILKNNFWTVKSWRKDETG